MEESILLSSDSNPSSPPLLPPDLDEDLDIPKAKLSDICGGKKSGLVSNVTSSQATTSSWLFNAEPIPSTSNYIPSFEIPDVGSKDSFSDVKADFTQRPASFFGPSSSGISRKTDAVTDLNVHQLSDSDAGLSDFLSDSENEPLVKKGDHNVTKNGPTNGLNQTKDAEEPPKWVSWLEEDTDPSSSRSSSTLPPDQAPDTGSAIPPHGPPESLLSSDSASTLPPETVHLPEQAPDTLLPSISNCSAIPPHRSPDSVLLSSDSASTLPPEAVRPSSLSSSNKFEKKPSFHDISDSDSSGTIEAAPSVFPDEIISEEFKFSYPQDISSSEDEPENLPCTRSSTSPPLLDDESPKILLAHSEPIFSNSYNISEFVSQLDNNSQPLTTSSSQPLASQKRYRTNAIDVLERKRLKELKIKEKSERAAVAERVRRMKPGECMKYITVVVDQNIASEYPWGPCVVEILQTAGIKCSVEVATDPCTVKWRREQADSLVPQQEKHVLFLWSTEKLLTSVQYGTLSDSFAEFKKKYENFKLYLCVYGLQNYYRKFHKAKQRQNSSSSPPQRKRKSNYEIIPDQLEMELIALQIKFGISHKILNSAQETAFFLQVITKSVAEMPFKLEKEKVEMERNWYAKGDSKKCVRIDKDFNGLRQLWLQQLSQFNLSSLDIAKSIAELYPTPLILYHAYRQCSSSKEKETMLQDIVVKRGPGGGGRRLGPELSRKISILFCQDEDIPLD